MSGDSLAGNCTIYSEQFYTCLSNAVSNLRGTCLVPLNCAKQHNVEGGDIENQNAEDPKFGSYRGWMLNTWYLPVSKVHQSKHLTAQRRFCLLFVVEVVSRRAAACICAPGSGLHLLGCRLGGDYDKLRGLCYHHVTIMFILCQICEITELSPTLLSQSQHTSSQESRGAAHLSPGMIFIWLVLTSCD